MAWFEWLRYHLFTPAGLQETILAWGNPALIAMVFAETGLLVGFWLPGDWLLFMVGVLAAAGHLDLLTLCWTLSLAAILGDSLGYWIGARVGKTLYDRPDGVIFKRKHLLHTREFYDRHGGKTIVLARFIAVIRTFAPVVAGIARMDYRRFVFFNVAGAVGWVVGLATAGFFLGRIPWVQANLEKVVLFIIFLSVLPLLIEALRSKLRGGAGEAGSVLPATVGIEESRLSVRKAG